MTDSDALKEKAALASITASALLTLGKLAAGLFSGSLALISEAGHGLLDTGATILTYFAIRASGKPADEEHHYGHGKVEAVAALAETGLLIVLSIYVMIEAVRRLLGHEAEPVEATWPVFAVLVVSIVVDLVRWRSLSAIAEKTKSDALAADALHFSSDLVASVCVLLGLAASRFGYHQGDALAAIGVSVFIGIAGYQLGRRTIDTLVDAAPKGLAEQIRTSVEAVVGVVNVESVRLRPAGPQVLIEAAREGGVISDVHHVRVRETANGLVVNYHCRADQALTVDQVHDAVDELDRRARRADATISRIVGHAEPVKG